MLEFFQGRRLSDGDMLEPRSIYDSMARHIYALQHEGSIEEKARHFTKAAELVEKFLKPHSLQNIEALKVEILKFYPHLKQKSEFNNITTPQALHAYFSKKHIFPTLESDRKNFFEEKFGGRSTGKIIEEFYTEDKKYKLQLQIMHRKIIDRVDEILKEGAASSDDLVAILNEELVDSILKNESFVNDIINFPSIFNKKFSQENMGQLFSELIHEKLSWDEEGFKNASAATYLCRSISDIRDNCKLGKELLGDGYKELKEQIVQLKNSCEHGHDEIIFLVERIEQLAKEYEDELSRTEESDKDILYAKFGVEYDRLLPDAKSELIKHYKGKPKFKYWISKIESIEDLSSFINKIPQLILFVDGEKNKKYIVVDEYIEISSRLKKELGLEVPRNILSNASDVYLNRAYNIITTKNSDEKELDEAKAECDKTRKEVSENIIGKLKSRENNTNEIWTDYLRTVLTVDQAMEAVKLAGQVSYDVLHGKYDFIEEAGKVRHSCAALNLPITDEIEKMRTLAIAFKDSIGGVADKDKVERYLSYANESAECLENAKAKLIKHYEDIPVFEKVIEKIRTFDELVTFVDTIPELFDDQKKVNEEIEKINDLFLNLVESDPAFGRAIEVFKDISSKYLDDVCNGIGVPDKIAEANKELERGKQEIADNLIEVLKEKHEHPLWEAYMSKISTFEEVLQSVHLIKQEGDLKKLFNYFDEIIENENTKGLEKELTPMILELMLMKDAENDEERKEIIEVFKRTVYKFINEGVAPTERIVSKQSLSEQEDKNSAVNIDRQESTSNLLRKLIVLLVKLISSVRTRDQVVLDSNSDNTGTSVPDDQLRMIDDEAPLSEQQDLKSNSNTASLAAVAGMFSAVKQLSTPEEQKVEVEVTQGPRRT